MMSIHLPVFVPPGQSYIEEREARANLLSKWERKLRALLQIIPDDDEEAIQECKHDIVLCERMLEELCQELTDVAA